MGVAFVIILVVLFVGVVVAGSYFASGWRNVETERIDFLTVEPNFICPSATCSVDIGYGVTTTHTNTQILFKVVGPQGSTRTLASSLTFSQTFNGADTTLWTDGPGVYAFVLEVTGDQIGSVTRPAVTTLFRSTGGVIPHSARVDMAQSEDLQVARDSFMVTELHKLKTPEYTICEKSAQLIEIRYVQGGVSGHPPDLDVTVRDGDGSIIADFPNMKPGDSVKLDPPRVISGGIQFDGTMVGGFVGSPPNSLPNPFFATDIVGWDLEIGVRCI